MPLFVHLAPEPVGKKVRFGGIKTSPLYLPGMDRLRGLYAFPVLPNFQVSHQWLRELKRGGCRTILGVYFRIPDDEEVIVGHYARMHKQMNAAQASGLLRHVREPAGYQVIVTRKVRSKEIHKVRSLPQTVGWRYWPDAHGQAPCGCPVCWDRGRMNSRNIREKWLERETELEQAVKSGAIQAIQSFY